MSAGFLSVGEHGQQRGDSDSPCHEDVARGLQQWKVVARTAKVDRVADVENLMDVPGSSSAARIEKDPNPVGVAVRRIAAE